MDFEWQPPERNDVEQLVLGAALTDAEAFPQIADLLTANDFCPEKHKRIFLRMEEIYARGEPITHFSVSNELHQKKQLESVDGVSYLVSLADGMPRLFELARYCQIVRGVSRKRQVATVLWEMIKRCLDPGDDAAELAVDVERVSEFINSSNHRLCVARTTEQVVADAGGVNVFLSPHRAPGIEIPFSGINTTLSGLRRSKLILLGARPAVGKTALACQIAEHAAGLGKTVLLVSLEMSAEDVIKRSVVGQAAVNSYAFREGWLTAAERGAIQLRLAERAELGDRLLHVEKSDITVQGIASLLRSNRARGNPVELCVIDYLQLLTPLGRFETRVQAVSSISRGLKQMAQGFGIPVLALSQLSRKEDHRKNDRPELDWLKESGQLEQDADQVVFLWSQQESPQKDPKKSDEIRDVNWRVAKNRDGGLNQGVLSFETRHCRFIQSASSEHAPSSPWSSAKQLTVTE